MMEPTCFEGAMNNFDLPLVTDDILKSQHTANNPRVHPYDRSLSSMMLPTFS
jgi:hypothetical protein